MSRRVGLLGGTFDPPHLGHLVVAECARVDLELDEVRLLVAGDPWMKNGVTPAEQRVRLVEAAVSGDEHLRLDDREVSRTGPTFTADTLEELVAEEPDTRWWFLIGVDAANEIDRWERIDAAFALATFVVVPRPGHAPKLAEPYASQVEHLEVPWLDVASRELRERYRDHRATRYLVPDAVDSLVRSLGLYGGDHG
jgi:nicotinate-nucleotide adenylyltransferase